jgi:hypothetical protein
MSPGTRVKSSRDTLDTIGTIMITSTTTAASILAPV